jgi:hypothetical protein
MGIDALLLFGKTHWKAIFVALALFSSIGYGKYQAWQKERAVEALQAYKIEVEVEAKTKEAENAKKVANREKITTNTAIAYADSIDRLRKYYEKDNRRFPAAYANGLRLDQNGSGGVSAVSEASGKPDAGAESDQPGSEGVAAVTVLDCATDVLTLLSLQKWVREQQILE